MSVPPYAFSAPRSGEEEVEKNICGEREKLREVEMGVGWEGNFAFLISSTNCTVMTLCYYQKFILANSQLPSRHTLASQRRLDTQENEQFRLEP